MTPTPSVTSHSSNAPAASAAPAPDTNLLANEDTFLKLLVSQLQYQDPLNPVDSTQFVSQLTGSSQLEQLIQIDHNTKTATSAAPADSSATPGKGATNSGSSISSSAKTSGI